MPDESFSAQELRAGREELEKHPGRIHFRDDLDEEEIIARLRSAAESEDATRPDPD